MKASSMELRASFTRVDKHASPLAEPDHREKRPDKVVQFARNQADIIPAHTKQRVTKISLPRILLSRW